MNELQIKTNNNVPVIANEKITTKELAKQLNTSPKVILENAKKCLPNKKIENGKATFWNKAEVTVLIDCLKNNSSNHASDLYFESKGAISTELTPSLKIKKAMEVTVEDAARGLEISVDDIFSFLKIKHYIMLDKGTWFATALGVKKGCTINTDNGLRLTEKCIGKIRGAFTYSLTPEQQKQIENLVKQGINITKYARLKTMKDNFIRAATKAEANDMIKLWTDRADETQAAINQLSISEAMEEVK